MWTILFLAVLAAEGRPPAARPVAQPRVTALILHKRGQSIGAYDAETGRKRGDAAAVGPIPHEMISSADGKRIYVTNYGVERFSDVATGANSITVMGAATLKREGIIDLGRYHRPHGIERGHSGRLYVTTDFPPSVLVIVPDAREGQKVLSVLALDQTLPQMLAVSADERKVYVSNAGSGTVTALTVGPQGERQAAANIRVGGVPMGVALSPDERSLYVATRDGDQVVVVDAASERVRATVPLPGQPSRLRLTPAGNHLVASLYQSGEVAIIDTRSLRVVHRFAVGAYAQGLTLDAIGGFGYVSVQGENKVVKFSLFDWKPVLEIKTAATPAPVLILR